MKKYLVSVDNGTGFVVARKDWVTVEAGTAHDAALIFAAARPELPASFSLDVVLLSDYERHHTWAGCLCHRQLLKVELLDHVIVGRIGRSDDLPRFYLSP